MSADVRRLERRIAKLERELRNLKRASSPVNLQEGPSGTVGLNFPNPNATNYPEFAARFSSDDSDLVGNPNGSAQVGASWSAGADEAWVGFVRHGMVIGVWKASAFRYVIEALYDTITFNAPFLPTGLTTTQRNALTPQARWTIYNTTTNKLQVYDGSSWQDCF